MAQFQILTDDEIASVRTGGAILRECLERVGAAVAPGITTGELDRMAEEFIRGQGAEPGFQGYYGFPATLCTSVNDECVHGVPGDRTLQEGDILSVDCGVYHDELCTDACRTFAVGTIDDEAGRLLAVTKQALNEAVQVIRGGICVGDISATVQRIVEGAGFSVVSALTGHGLGTTLHQPPDIPNVGTAGSGPVLPAGMLIAVEPIVAVGRDGIRHGDDNWTICTRDGSLSAHFEHTILVTEEGREVMA